MYSYINIVLIAIKKLFTLDVLLGYSFIIHFLLTHTSAHSLNPHCVCELYNLSQTLNKRSDPQTNVLTKLSLLSKPITAGGANAPNQAYRLGHYEYHFFFIQFQHVVGEPCCYCLLFLKKTDRRYMHFIA